MNSLNTKIIQSLHRLARWAKPGLGGTAEQTNLDKKLVFSLAKSRWPSFKQLKYLKRYLSPSEKLIVNSCLFVVFFSSLFLAARFYKTHLQVIPVNGGDYTEGVVGSIKYINPLYAIVSDVDSDIAGLVYSSLFRRGEDGQLENDLAQSYGVSQDNKIYVVKIRPDARWHNGGAVTADDIIFTFQAIKDFNYKSPLRSAFTGVEIEKADDQTIKFILAEPYAAFTDLLTFGVLPKDLWQQIEPAAASLAELNFKPIGSGRYKFKSLVKDSSGNIRTYNLVRNDDYYGDRAHINNFSFKFFGNVTELISALNNNLVSGLSYLPEQSDGEVVARDSLNFHRLNLPKMLMVFFNVKSYPAFADKRVRQALAQAVNKDKIVSNVLAGNGRTIDGPILPDSYFYWSGLKKFNYDSASSSQLLAQAGWKAAEITAADIDQAKILLNSKNEIEKKQAQAKIDMGPGKWLVKDNNYLVIDLTTVDNPEYSQTAAELAKFWRAVNVKVNVNLVPANQIQAEVIKTRNFAALIYGEITGADPDPYAFWHSSQIGPSGLNIADYANKEVDKLLEDGRLTNDLKIRQEKYRRFQEILSEDQPAIYLYSPSYTYVQAKSIKGFNVKKIILPSDRFADVGQWYIKTGKKIVW